jgi:uncharacterized protein (AIM24 family)
VEDRLAGSIVPVLSVSLDPGESIVAEAGEFSWMTDSIQMTGPDAAALAANDPAANDPGDDGAAMPLSTFTAKAAAGTVAFASRLPGSILGVDVGTHAEYLVHRDGFVAGTAGLQVLTGYRQSFAVGAYAQAGFALQRVRGTGRAWVGFAGDIVRLDLAAGESLRAHPGHVGMFAVSVAFQLMRVPGLANRSFGPDAHYFAVLSGPGPVWLQTLASAAAAAPSGHAPPRPRYS